MTIEWYGDQVLNASKIVLKGTSEKVAEKVMEDAKKILKKKSTDYGTKKNAYGYGIDGLVSQFYIEPSKFKNGGFLAWCQGPKNWKPPYSCKLCRNGNI
jgi:hypothetical protein